MNIYAAIMKCDAAIIYGTKAGVEPTSMGIPVIVAKYRGKGGGHIRHHSGLCQIVLQIRRTSRRLRRSALTV
jgi:hypothetical protein